MSRPDRTTFQIWEGEIKAIGIEISNADSGVEFEPDSATVSFYNADDDTAVIENVTAMVDDNTVSVMVPSAVYSDVGEYYAVWKIRKAVNTTSYTHLHPSDIKVRPLKQNG